MVRSIATTVFVLLPALGAAQFFSNFDPQRPYPMHWEFMDIRLDLQEDGSLEVEETFKYVFQGKPPIGRRRGIRLEEGTRVEQVRIFEKGTSLPVTMEMSADFFLIFWSHPLKPPESHTFTLRYRLTGTVQSEHARGKLVWEAITANRPASVHNVKVTVRLPPSLAGKIRAFESFGFPTDRRRVDDRTVEFVTHDPMPPGEALLIEVDYPRGRLAAPGSARAAGETGAAGSDDAAVELDWSTYLGGKDREFAERIATDDRGNLYVTGLTTSPDFPTPGGFDTTFEGLRTLEGDAFVAKFSAEGALLWSTFLGGGRGDAGSGIAVDAAGCVYVVGKTRSEDFPAFLAHDTTFNGGDSSAGDGFVAKFDPGGTLLWSTFFGGSRNDWAWDVVLDTAGRLYVSGWTASPDFPTSGPTGAPYNGGAQDLFAAKFSAAGQLLWSTCLGGTGHEGDKVRSALDPEGNLYVAGSTESEDFLTPRGYDMSHNGGRKDVCLAKFAPDGTLRWATYLGGKGVDTPHGLALDRRGEICVTGTTSSSDFPGRGAGAPSLRGHTDLFVAKFSSGGDLVWSTYLGGSRSETGFGPAVDAAGAIYVTGVTTSLDLPIAGAFDAGYNGGATDAFVAKLTADGELLWASYLGGTEVDAGRDLATDRAGNVYVAGVTRSTDFPSWGGYDRSYNGSQAPDGRDTFVAKITPRR